MPRRVQSARRCKGPPSRSPSPRDETKLDIVLDDSGKLYNINASGELEEKSKDPQVNGHALTNGEKQRQPQAAMAAEIKYVEKRHDKNGNSYTTGQLNTDPNPEKINWWEKFALCVTRQMDRSNRYVEHTSLQINSRSLKDLLKFVIGEFPGQSYTTKKISVPFPLRSLFHYRHEIAKVGHEWFQDGSDGAEHLSLLLGFIEQQFEETISEGENLLEEGLVLYEHLWTLLRPRTIVFARNLGQPRAFRAKSYAYQCGMCPCLSVNVEYVAYDGKAFGTMPAEIRIPAYQGAQSIASLALYPLKFHEFPIETERSLVARGRLFETYTGQNFQEYNGIAIYNLNGQTSRFTVQGRVMIDTATYNRVNANSAFEVTPFNSKNPSQALGLQRFGSDTMEVDMIASKSTKLEPLTDEQCILADAMVRGFCFTEKKFFEFFVENLSVVQWNNECFDQLVLPQSHKDTVRALVATHSANGHNGFDDIVKGKGKGLVLVLHGPPGVGKTLTAECVAEFSKRPLYIVSSGDLGTCASSLDSELSNILDLASTWKAVLLIDEADVFLEARSSYDIERNALVSIFLRVLEYYEGILFLTTNRVKAFDDAFKSRIHVPLKYPDLDQDSRLRIWKNFLAKVDDGADIDENTLEDLSQSELNGRQIKNAIRTAKSLAKFNDRKLNRAQLEQILDIQVQFEETLNSPD